MMQQKVNLKQTVNAQRFILPRRGKSLHRQCRCVRVKLHVWLRVHSWWAPGRICADWSQWRSERASLKCGETSLRTGNCQNGENTQI